MVLPFTQEEFLSVFSEYNTAIDPMPIAGYFFAIVIVLAIQLRKKWAGTFTGFTLGMMWIWNGAVYQIGYFSAINKAAYGFGTLMIVEGILLIRVAIRWDQINFQYSPNWKTISGYILIIYSMIVYSVIGTMLGHGYPQSPVFGVAPCPTTIFTFGILLLLRKPYAKFLLIIPVLWAAIGTVAALQLGIREDVLLIAGPVVFLIDYVLNRSKTK